MTFWGIAQLLSSDLKNWHVSHILFHAINSNDWILNVFVFFQVTDDVDNLVIQILSLLEHEASQYVKQSAQYFEFFYSYALTVVSEDLYEWKYFVNY